MDFKDIKVGDKVVCSRRYSSGTDVFVVEHVTPTRFSVGYIHYKKSDGREYGASSTISSMRALRIATDDDVTLYRRARVRALIRFPKDAVITDEILDGFAELFDRCVVRW